MLLPLACFHPNFAATEFGVSKNKERLWTQSSRALFMRTTTKRTINLQKVPYLEATDLAESGQLKVPQNSKARPSLYDLRENGNAAKTDVCGLQEAGARSLPRIYEPFAGMYEYVCMYIHAFMYMSMSMCIYIKIPRDLL